MSKKNKLMLSILGLGALVIPVILLVITTQRTSQIPEVSQEKRPIDTATIQDAANKTKETVSPSPSPASPSATPAEGTGGAR